MFLSPSGYSASTPFAGREPGSNGLAPDATGRLVICEHGDRRLLANDAPWTRVRRRGPDGLETDAAGNLFAAGPEAVFVFAADGTLLGVIDTGVPTANVAWGEDGSTLLIAADTRILHLRTTACAAQWNP